MSSRLATRELRILDFDIENRPLTYLGNDFTFGEITAIAWGWLDEPGVSVRALGVQCQHSRSSKDSSPRCGVYHYGCSQKTMIEDFLEVYTSADMVTGHYIRSHDLSPISGSMLELGMGPLPPKLTSDTKNDLRRHKNFPASQAALGEALARFDQWKTEKVSMSSVSWRDANRLTPEGIARTTARCTGDVIQHRQIRAQLIEAGWVGPPKVWRP